MSDLKLIETGLYATADGSIEVFCNWLDGPEGWYWKMNSKIVGPFDTSEKAFVSLDLTRGRNPWKT